MKKFIQFAATFLVITSLALPASLLAQDKDKEQNLLMTIRRQRPALLNQIA